MFKFLLILIFVKYIRCCNQSIANDFAERHRRSLVFPYNSATGVIVAIAVPIDIPKRNVYMSYNFEANYPMPIVSTDYTKGILERLDIEQFDENPDEEARNNKNGDKLNHERENSTKSENHIARLANKTSLINRQKLYQIIEHKLKVEGFNGRACLLFAICETAEHPLNEHNGVLGDIFQIILTPTLSMREDIHPEYYIAEKLGQAGNCNKYKKYCPESVLNIFTILMQHHHP